MTDKPDSSTPKRPIVLDIPPGGRAENVRVTGTRLYGDIDLLRVSGHAKDFLIEDTQQIASQVRIPESTDKSMRGWRFWALTLAVAVLAGLAVAYAVWKLGWNK